MLKVENPPYDMAAPFGGAAAEGAQMMVVLSSPLFIPHHRRIAEQRQAGGVGDGGAPRGPRSDTDHTGPLSRCSQPASPSTWAQLTSETGLGD
jgi:hypothetical protein